MSAVAAIKKLTAILDSGSQNHRMFGVGRDLELQKIFYNVVWKQGSMWYFCSVFLFSF